MAQRITEPKKNSISARQMRRANDGKTPAALTQPGADSTRSMKKVYGPLGYVKELFARFGADQCGSWAASLSFFAVLSLAPTLLCGLAVLGFLIHNPQEAANKVQQAIAGFVPDPATANSVVAQLNIQQAAETLMKSRGIALIVGLLSLVWAALQIFVNAAPPMNAAFRAKETRGFVRLRTVALGLLFGVGVLFVLALAATSAAQLIGGFLHLSDTMTGLVAVIFGLVSIAINAVMFTVIYRYMPSPAAGVKWKSAVFAGAIVAVLWEIAKQGFGVYLSHFGNYDKLYGTLGGLVALVFWIYYSSMILLLGAEIAGLHRDAINYDAQKTARA